MHEGHAVFSGLWVRLRWPRAALTVGLCLVMLTWSGGAWAARELSFIRDAEIESYLRTYATPLFHAAGVEPDAVNIYLVEDHRLNAFVAGGRNMFFHTGLLRETESPLELLGVIAHETGHIAGRDLLQIEQELKGLSATQVLATMLGAGLAVMTGDPSAVAAGLVAGGELRRRELLAFSRAQEAQADQAALRFLDRSGMSAEGLESFLEKLLKQEYLPEGQQSEYVRTHPLTQDRVDHIRTYVEHSPYTHESLPESYLRMHRRMQAKLDGFLQPEYALRKYSASDRSFTARYARAIALYRNGNPDAGIAGVDDLLKDEPENPYLYELKGQILLEHGRVREAIPAYRNAVERAPEQALLRTALAQSLLQLNDPSLLDEALRQLTVAQQREPESSYVWRLTAVAWGRKGNRGMTHYALAEEALAKGDQDLAVEQAKRAEDLLPPGSPAWIRAQDIRAFARREQDR